MGISVVCLVSMCRLSAACLARPRSRQAITTCQPRRTIALVVCRPTPEEAPVTMTVGRSGFMTGVKNG